MQKKAPNTQVTHSFVDVIVAVLFIPHQTMPLVAGVHPYLVSSTGDWPGLNQRYLREGLQHLEFGQAWLACRVNPDKLFAITHLGFQQWRLYPAALCSPVPHHQRPIDIAYVAGTLVAQCCLKMTQQTALVGNHEAAGSIPNQPMNPLQVASLGAQLAQCLNQPQ